MVFEGWEKMTSRTIRKKKYEKCSANLSSAEVIMQHRKHELLGEWDGDVDRKKMMKKK